MVELANGWKLRFRQEECHDKLIDAYLKGNKDFFIAAVCRFGKTITTMASLRDLGDLKNPESQVIMILSTMNVKAEWYDGTAKAGFDTSLIGKNSNEMTDINSIDFSEVPETGKHVVYASTQKLGNNSEVSNALIKWFNRHEGLKTLVYDECHLGSGTLRTAGGDIKEVVHDEDGNTSLTEAHVTGIIERLDFDNRVYLSGTPYRKYLNKEFHLDSEKGDEICYRYTLTDEKIDYKNGLIKDYKPVQLQMWILDYSTQMQEVIDETEQIKECYNSISTAYFKKIFKDSALKDRAIEFLNRIIQFSKEHNIHNWLFYVPQINVAADIKKNFSKMYEDQIEFLNISSKGDFEDEELYEKNVSGVNQLFAKNDGKIKIAITCQKCGTGSTMKDLEAVAFLKDTTNAIQFIQKSQRPRTPKEGKSVGYVLCFNTFEGLQAFKDYARAESKSNNDHEKEEDVCNEFFENDTVELYLGLKKVEDYATLIDLDNTYIPGRYPLFQDFNFSEWPDGTFTFLTTVKGLCASIVDKLSKKLRNDPSIQNAKNPDELIKALEAAGKNKEAETIKNAIKKQLTEEECRELLEVYFVDTIRSIFFSLNKSREEVLDTDSYDDFTKEDITECFGTIEVWQTIIENYPRYINMIYNLLEKGF